MSTVTTWTPLLQPLEIGRHHAGRVRPLPPRPRERRRRRRRQLPGPDRPQPPPRRRSRRPPPCLNSHLGSRRGDGCARTAALRTLLRWRRARQHRKAAVAEADERGHGIDRRRSPDEGAERSHLAGRLSPIRRRTRARRVDAQGRANPPEAGSRPSNWTDAGRGPVVAAHSRELRPRSCDGEPVHSCAALPRRRMLRRVRAGGRSGTAGRSVARPARARRRRLTSGRTRHRRRARLGSGWSRWRRSGPGAAPGGGARGRARA